MQKPLVAIESWAVVQRRAALSYGELEPGKHLVGKVVGHKTLSSAEYVYTSPIVRVDLSGRLVETQNTLYLLGQVSAEYKNWEEAQSAVAAA